MATVSPGQAMHHLTIEGSGQDRRHCIADLLADLAGPEAID